MVGLVALPLLVNNQLVGVERSVNGVWVAIQTDPGGFFVTDDPGIVFLFTSLDCSGTPYMDASTLPPIGFVTKPARMVFPGVPVQLLTILALRPRNDPNCNPFGAPRWVGPAQSFGLNNLGLLPPFTVK